MLNRTILFGLLMAIGAAPALAMDNTTGPASFTVNTPANETFPLEDENVDEIAAEENAEEPDADAAAVRAESAVTPPAAEEKPDPCAAYKSPRGKIICEDRMMKIERMQNAKEGRTNYNDRRRESLTDRAPTTGAEQAAEAAETAEGAAQALQEAANELGAAEAAQEKELRPGLANDPRAPDPADNLGPSNRARTPSR